MFCVTYLETKSFKRVEAKFSWKFDINSYSQKSQICRLENKSKNFTKKAENPRYSKKFTARYPNNVDVLRDSDRRSPKRFLRRCYQEFGLSCVAFQKILKRDLWLYPYKIQIKHKLTPADINYNSLSYQWVAFIFRHTVY